MSLKRQLAEEESFLGRWSRLKRAQEEELKPAIEPAEPPLEPAQAPIQELSNPQDEPVEPLPDLETLGPGSDFKPFMQTNIAPELRTKALRKLWASNPLYNHIDMLDDYCEDYTDKAMVIPGMKTAYQVGRGFLEKIEQVAETELAQETDVVLEEMTPIKPDKTEET